MILKWNIRIKKRKRNTFGKINMPCSALRGRVN
jgi:hypothetical protein